MRHETIGLLWVFAALTASSASAQDLAYDDSAAPTIAVLAPARSPDGPVTGAGDGLSPNDTPSQADQSDAVATPAPLPAADAGASNAPTPIIPVAYSSRYGRIVP